MTYARPGRTAETRLRILSIGEIIWDVVAPSEYLGGAPLNFGAHAHKLGHEVYLLSAVGDDDRGRRALEGLDKCGICADFVQVIPGKRTGTAEVELDPGGKPMFRIMRPAAYDFVDLNPTVITRIAEVRPNWIYFGTLFHNSRHALESTLRLLEHLPDAKKFFDVNLRDGNWNLTTVEQLASRQISSSSATAKPNSWTPLWMAKDWKHRSNISAGAGVSNTVARPSA